ncbi:SLAM family member 6 isoform X2 [Pteropus medius]|uniref:SLAM family member 6 isoform X2 n=1 Tax=Pteropus vampyrus TaxID=132908 RepID=UPI00196AAB58|nr:SLAM family member 6 isoform X2 [Pteropus giganteus]
MNLTAVKSPAPVSSAKSMVWLFQFLMLAFLIGPGYTVSQTEETPLKVKGVLGESVTLPLKISAGEEIEFIIWLFNGTSITFLQPKKKLIQVTDPKRKHRLKITQSYFLQINELMMADEGLYRAQITTIDSSLIFDYSVRIFERLRNLQVSNHTQIFENGTCEIHLACSVENPNDHISFRWQVSENILLQEANLTISWDSKNSSEQTYTCIAENPVSNLSFSFSVQSLCKSVFHEKNQYLAIWFTTTAFLLAFLVCLFFWKRKIAGSSCFSARQTLNLAENPRNAEDDPSSAGNTVYIQVTHPNTRKEIATSVENNDSSTIYSTVYQSNRATALDNVI